MNDFCITLIDAVDVILEFCPLAYIDINCNTSGCLNLFVQKTFQNLKFLGELPSYMAREYNRRLRNKKPRFESKPSR